MNDETAGTAPAPEVKPAPAPLDALTARVTKAAKPQRLNTLHNCTVTVDEENGGDIVIRIPGRIPYSAIFSSKTDKATPMVTLMPKFGDGRPGALVVPVTVYSGEGENETESKFGLRLGCMNGFITKY